MTRNDAIATITTHLDALDDERLAAIAELVLGNVGGLPRPLTARELAAIEQSKEDFRAGRTMTAKEAFASIDARLEKLGLPKSA